MAAAAATMTVDGARFFTRHQAAPMRCNVSSASCPDLVRCCLGRLTGCRRAPACTAAFDFRVGGSERLAVSCSR